MASAVSFCLDIVLDFTSQVACLMFLSFLCHSCIFFLLVQILFS
uniref:Uncharacterized protein n=1 Tax=Rhizophora mucronata TaxID=61149 RepID=A0A2P2NWN7_RHIMU